MALAIATLLGLIGWVCGENVQWIRQEAAVPVHNSETSSWLKHDRAPASEVMELTVALRVDPERRQEMERTLFEVSDPRHDRYGKFLSIDEITALLAVPKERVAIARRYFEEAGVTDITAAPNRDTLAVTATVSVVEAALKTTIHIFTHPEHPGVRILRASEPYWLPAEVSAQVAMVGELLQFPRVSKRLRSTGAAQVATWPNECSEPACEGMVTPGVLAQRYNIPKDDLGELGSNSMSVAEFQGQYFKWHDLWRFRDACDRNVTVDSVIGGNRPRPGEESEMDIEYIRAVAPGVPLTVYYQDNYSLLKWVQAVSQLASPPLVHSVSYGNDEKQQVSEAYMDVCNLGFMKAGARGLSILFASGDQGVCGREGCGKESTGIRFNPDFPAASPFITAVGGTDFLEKGVIGDETSWSASGGGFSDHFPRPDYQKEAVQAYLENPVAELPPSGMWNSSGRGYPDIAALGGIKNYYCVSTGNQFVGIAGTSASCPVVAGVFARLNGMLLEAGKPPLGFLNPLIYQYPQVWQDVAHGINDDGKGHGFKAIKGWDPATGFGTPNVGKLVQAVLGAGVETDIVV